MDHTHEPAPKAAPAPASPSAPLGLFSSWPAAGAANAEHVLALQRTVGNAAVTRWLTVARPPAIAPPP